jgi:outer membrane receptor for monomeric catechols
VLDNMNIIFTFIVSYYSSDMQFKFELSKEIQLNVVNLIDIAKTLRNTPKFYMLV